MVSRIKKLIGTNRIVEVEITQGLGSFPYKNTCLMNIDGINCIKVGTNSALFLAQKEDYADENFMTPLVIPKNTKLSKENIENETTGADIMIVGQSSSLIFKISCITQPA